MLRTLKTKPDLSVPVVPASSATQSEKTAESPSSLCSACGFCCDGTLFDQVEISRTDAPRTLAARGAKLKREKRILPQPCSAHKNGACAVYDILPNRCKLFTCNLLAKFSKNEISFSEALATIRHAVEKIAETKRLLAESGDERAHRPLRHRIGSALASLPPVPEDPAALHSRLSLAVSQLDDALTPFSTEADKPCIKG